MKNAAAPPQAVPAWSTTLQTVLLLVLTTIIGVRPLIQETHDTARTPIDPAASTIASLTPGVTLGLNLAIGLIAVITATLVALGHIPRRGRTGLGIATAVIAAGAIASCMWAGNQRVALTATVDWLCGPLLAMSLAALLTHAWKRRLVVAVVVATGVAAAVQCHDQVWFTMPDTREHYERNKEGLWASQGVALDSPQVVMFERRLNDPRAATGFFAFSNVAGSYLLLPLFAVAGVAWSARRRGAGVLPAVMAMLVVASALYWTGSRGAIVGAIGALVLAGIFHLVLRRTTRRTALISIWALIGAVTIGAGAVGLRAGGFPDGSLTFRWWYLEASARMFADHPLTGVGSDQYGRYFPRYKEIKCPEEVAYPHNFVAHAACAWGIAGLVGVGLALWRGSRMLTLTESDADEDPAPDPRRQALLLIGLTVAVFGLRAVLARPPDINYLLATWTFPVLGWALALAGCAAAGDFTIRGARGWWCVGVVAFCAHNLLTFALFIPGAHTAFFAMLALAAPSTKAPTRPRPRWAAVAGLSGGAILATLLVVAMLPPVRAAGHLRRARALAAADPIRAMGAYADAAEADRLDPEPLREALTLAAAHGLPGAGGEALIARDPHNPATWRLVAALAARRGNLDAAVRAGKRVIQLYPTNPEDHVRLAEWNAGLFETTRESERLEAAIAGYQAGLAWNDRRAPDEIRRFPATRVAAIQAEIERLKALRQTPPPASP